MRLIFNPKGADISTLPKVFTYVVHTNDPYRVVIAEDGTKCGNNVNDQRLEEKYPEGYEVVQVTGPNDGEGVRAAVEKARQNG